MLSMTTESSMTRLIWSGKRSAGAVADRLWDLQRGRLSPEARHLSDRFPEAVIDALGAMSDNDWPELDDEESIIV